MGISISTFLDNRRLNKSGKYPVKIRVTYKRERKYYSTGKELTLEEWDKLLKSKSPTLIEIRRDIQLSFEKVKETIVLLEESNGFSFDALNVQLGKGVTDSLNTAFKNKIDNLKNEDIFICWQ